MHRISKVRVENYKSIIDGEFPLASYTPLVGYNNAGKTNVLKALSWVVKKNGLPTADFFDPEKPIVITAEISGITAEVLDAIEEKHRKKIEPVVVDGLLQIRRTQQAPDAKVSDIRLEVWKLNNEGVGSWEVNPTGIDAAISHLFPEPLFIGAMENATEDVGKFGASTTIGKLIKEIIEPITAAHAGPINEALSDISAKLSAESPTKDQNLIDLDFKIQRELGTIFPGVSAKTHIPTPEFADFLKGATIKIFEESYHNPEGRDASSFGHGAQRSVQIALIKCLAEIKKENAGTAARTTLLLIDEPELYLHPQAIELIRASLRRLSGEGYQVVFSTHSANMIAREDAQNALLIRRNVAAGTRAYPRIQDAVRDSIADAEHQSETLFTLTNATKILFSERVVLAEGKTEQAILPDIYSHECGKTFDEDKTGLVALGSSGNIPGAIGVLRAMGIVVKAVVDLDFAFKVACQIGMIAPDHPAILACKGVFVRLAGENKCVVDQSDLPTKGNGVSAAKAFELMAAEADAQPHVQTLHDLLLQQGIWLWKNGAIEAHLGLASKKPAAHMAFLRDLPSDQFRNGLPDYPGAQAMLTWLRQN